MEKRNKDGCEFLEARREAMGWTLRTLAINFFPLIIYTIVVSVSRNHNFDHNLYIYNGNLFAISISMLTAISMDQYERDKNIVINERNIFFLILLVAFSAPIAAVSLLTIDEVETTFLISFSMSNIICSLMYSYETKKSINYIKVINGSNK